MNTTLLKNKVSFKPQLLFKNEKWIKERHASDNEVAAKFNTAIAEVEPLFERKLTPDEKASIIKNGWPYVETLIKKESQFPNAEIETLLSLYGKDATAAKKALQGIANHYRKIDECVFVKNEFIISTETRESVENIGTYYTKSQKQNEALYLAQNMSNLLNKSLQSGFILGLDTVQISNFLKTLITIKNTGKMTTGRNPSPILEYVPNYEKIRFID